MLTLSNLSVLAATLLVAAGLVLHLLATLAAARSAEQVTAPVEVMALSQQWHTVLVTSGGREVPLLVDDERGPGAPTPSSPPSRWGAAALTTDLLALGLLTVALVARALATGHGPFANQYEFAVAFAWGMLAGLAVAQRRLAAAGVALLVLPIALAMLLYAVTLDAQATPLVPALHNHLLLTTHVFAAVLAYGAAGVACAAALLALARPRLRSRALPSVARLEEIAYRAVVVAFPLMTLMLILGSVWADIAWGSYWSWDPKETAALVTWLIYGAYLHARVVRGWRGQRASLLLVLGFAAVLFTYFGNLFLGGLHTYA